MVDSKQIGAGENNGGACEETPRSTAAKRTEAPEELCELPSEAQTQGHSGGVANLMIHPQLLNQ